MLVSLKSDPALTHTQANCSAALKLLDWTGACPTLILHPLLSELYSVPSRAVL